MRILPVTSKAYAAPVAVLVGLLGAALLVFAFNGQEPPPRAPDPVVDAGDSGGQEPRPTATAGDRRGSTGKGHRGTEDRITGPVLPVASPISVSIPRIDVTSHLETLGVDDRGTMEVPADPAAAGWYRLGPTPGALGPAVISGHVTWNQVPAVFFRLAELRPGDAIRVSREDGRVAVFEVTHVRTYVKSRFATRAVFGGIDHAGLRLITCGGEFDETAHRYSDNVVAFARLASVDGASRRDLR